MGGTYRPDTDTLPNLLALRPDVHNGPPDAVHMRRQWSEEHGYLLPLSIPLASAWPVLLFGRRWVYLLRAEPWYMDVPRR